MVRTPHEQYSKSTLQILFAFIVLRLNFRLHFIKTSKSSKPTINKLTVATSTTLKARSDDLFLRIRFLVPKLEAGVHTVKFQDSVFVVRMSEGHL